MKKISFYLIENTAQTEYDITFRLCRQIMGKHRIWLYIKDDTQLQQFNLSLWQCEPQSFLPHGIEQLHAPICLSKNLPHPNFDVCINLTSHVLDLHQISHHIHLIHIINSDEKSKQIGREHFKYYRDTYITPAIHRL